MASSPRAIQRSTISNASPRRAARGLLLVLLGSSGCGAAAEADGGSASVSSEPASAGLSEPDPRCAGGESGQILITTQAELNALEGCAWLDASVYIEPRSGSLDLRPLGALRRVTGQFLIGCNPFAGFEANCEGASDVAVTSLEGLNALEQAGRLQFAQLRVDTLAPLTNLRRVGFLGITSCAGLADLDGLGQLEQVDDIELTHNPDLRSLDGLPALPGLRSIVLERDPALTDIGALSGSTGLERIALNAVPVQDLSPLAGLDTLDDFSLSSTAVRDLDALRLRHVRRLYIDSNRELAQVDALGALESFDSITLMMNPRLSRLPEFGSVSQFFDFSVFFNPLLDAGPSFPKLIRSPSSSITFQGNDALLRLDGFRSLEQGGSITVVENPSLRALDLSALGEVGVLRVLCNPQLAPEALAPLRNVRGGVTLPDDSAEPCP